MVDGVQVVVWNVDVVGDGWIEFIECLADEMLFGENELNLCGGIVCSEGGLLIGGGSVCVCVFGGGGGIENGGDSGAGGSIGDGVA